MEDKKNKFNYGESIKILKNAPKKYHPSEIGFVCGMIDIDSNEVAIAYDCIGSNWLYTVELLNGNSLQIPEKFLEKDNKFMCKDIIKIKKNAPKNFYPNNIGVICEVFQIESEKIAEKYESRINYWLYTVEFNKGFKEIIPEEYLEQHITKTL